MARCIWCKSIGDKSVEHIFPEGIGCGEDFILSDGSVCRKCNNELGYLDKILLNDFDLNRFMAGVPRKGGRPPLIDSRGNMVGEKTPSGYEIAINMEKYPVTAFNGKTLAPYKGTDRNLNASFVRNGDEVTIRFQTQIGKNRKFVRAIIKIAFTLLAYYCGSKLVLRDEFDGIRDFVKKGRGIRHIFMVQTSDPSYRNEPYQPYTSYDGKYSVVFRLVFAEFVVDLSPHETLYPTLKERIREARGDTGWTFLPLND